MMALLLFEIWDDPEHSAVGFSAVSEQGDKLRKLVEPNAVRVHSFFASSDFEAFQMNYDWHGWGVWKPEPNW